MRTLALGQLQVDSIMLLGSSLFDKSIFTHHLVLLQIERIRKNFFNLLSKGREWLIFQATLSLFK